MSAINATQRVLESDFYTSGKVFNSAQIAEFLDKSQTNAGTILYSMAADGLLCKMPGTGYKKSSNARYWIGLSWRAGIYLDDEMGIQDKGPLEWRQSCLPAL